MLDLISFVVGGRSLETTHLCTTITHLLADYKANDVRVLDVRGRCSFADFLIVASGTSDRHVQAIAERLSADLARSGERCLAKEGLQSGQWALLDYGDVVLHIFHPYSRELYALEQLWQPEQLDSPQTSHFGATSPDGPSFGSSLAQGM